MNTYWGGHESRKVNRVRTFASVGKLKHAELASRACAGIGRVQVFRSSCVYTTCICTYIYRREQEFSVNGKVTKTVKMHMDVHAEYVRTGNIKNTHMHRDGVLYTYMYTCMHAYIHAHTCTHIRATHSVHKESSDAYLPDFDTCRANLYGMLVDGGRVPGTKIVFSVMYLC